MPGAIASIVRCRRSPFPRRCRNRRWRALDRLAPVKEVAQIGAAVGRGFSYALLRSCRRRVQIDEPTLGGALAQLAEAETDLRRAAPRRNVDLQLQARARSGSGLRELLKSRRQLLHQHIGDVLRDKFPVIAETEPEVLAFHFTEAGLNGTALEWWCKAGQQALRRSAYTEAIAHLGKAVAIADALPAGPGRTMNRLQLQITYGRALRGSLGHSAPETVAAWKRARRFAADINDPVELAPIHSGLFNACLTHGELRRCGSWWRPSWASPGSDRNCRWPRSSHTGQTG